MKDNQEILSSILKTTQMGQSGIRCVMGYAETPAMRSALKLSLREYDEIEQEAERIARHRAMKVSELAPIAKSMSSMMSRMKLQFGDTDSKIADMMILGNTRGIIKGIRNRNSWNGKDEEIGTLAQKLIDYETENISQMKKFL